MRIISGKYGSRRLKTPKGRDIRPTSDKIRQAVFNALIHMGVVNGARVLDCFCGTGALGLEALSQGAAWCTFIDRDRGSLRLAKENAAVLGVENADFLLKDATKLPVRVPDLEPYSLIFLDPPYSKGFLPPTLNILHEKGWLSPGAICVAEMEKQYDLKVPEFYEIISERTYKDTKIVYLKYIHNQ